MLTFALVAGPAIPDRVRSALWDPSPTDLPFEASQHLVWSNPAGTVLFAGWQDHGDLGTGSGWAVDEAGLTAFTGHVWPRSGVWPPGRSWAEQLGAHFVRNRSLRYGTEDLLGVFTVISLGLDGTGTVATDALGTSLLYRAETGRTGILSSRAGVAARLAAGGTPSRDAFGVGWLAYCGYQVGARTGYEGVEVLPFGVHVDVTFEGELHFRQTPPPWRTLPDSHGDAIDEVYADIATSIRAALSFTVDQRVAELTGGKDSRLILAVLLAEELAEEFAYQTMGGPDLPDVVIARQLASTFGLRHESGIDAQKMQRAARRRERLSEALPGVSAREREFRLNVGDWAGTRNGWQLHPASPPRGDRVALCGIYGETLATNQPFSNRLVNHAAVRQSLLVDMKFGAAGILKPVTLERYRADVMADAYNDMTFDDVPQDVSDAFYLRNRLRRWFGTTLECNEQHRVLPLHSLTGVRLAFTLGPRDRLAHTIHRQLYRMAFPALVEHPFKNVPWRDEPWPDRRPEPTTQPALRPLMAQQRASSRSVAALEWRRPSEADDIDMMRRYLLGDSSNPVFELLDHRAVESAVDHFSALDENAKHQLYGALTAAMWLGHHEVTLTER